MGHYFYLSTSLPALEIGKAPTTDFGSLIETFELELSRSDMEKVNLIRSYYDLKNVLHVLDQEEIEPYGTMDRVDLEEAISDQVQLPEYLFEYLNKYDDEVDTRRHFSEVFVQFFREMDRETSGFLRKFFRFEREIRLVLMVSRGIALGRDIGKLLQYEDLGDDFVAWLLVQKDAKRFEFPHEYEDLERALQDAGDSPIEQFKAINLYKFRYFADLYLEKPFSMDALLVYMAQLILLESIYRLSEEEGQTLVTMMSKEK